MIIYVHKTTPFESDFLSKIGRNNMFNDFYKIRDDIINVFIENNKRSGLEEWIRERQRVRRWGRVEPSNMEWRVRDGRL